MSASPSTILVVDAHDDSRDIYAAVLRHGGFGVVECAGWDDALAAAEAAPPRVVVLELPLMATSAWAALHALKAHPRLRDVPVVGVGTTCQPEARRGALALGCAAYLVKPCGPLEVLAACRQWSNADVGLS